MKHFAASCGYGLAMFACGYLTARMSAWVMLIACIPLTLLGCAIGERIDRRNAPARRFRLQPRPRTWEKGETQ